MTTQTMYILLALLCILLVLWFLYSWLPVRNIEEPKYMVLKTADDYEIRQYEPYILAETTITGVKDRQDAVSRGFSIVAGYIFGDNTSKANIAMTVLVNTSQATSEKIAMTVPVNTAVGEGNGTYQISFVMPSKYTLKTLPEPNDSRVNLIEMPARSVAVRQFSWSNTESNFQKQETALLEALNRDGVTTVGSITIARYNTPWTIPFMLRSEIQIEVEQLP